MKINTHCLTTAKTALEKLIINLLQVYPCSSSFDCSYCIYFHKYSIVSKSFYYMYKQYNYTDSHFYPIYIVPLLSGQFCCWWPVKELQCSWTIKSDFLRMSRIGRQSRKIDFSFIWPKHTFGWTYSRKNSLKFQRFILRPKFKKVRNLHIMAVFAAKMFKISHFFTKTVGA